MKTAPWQSQELRRNTLFARFQRLFADRVPINLRERSQKDFYGQANDLGLVYKLDGNFKGRTAEVTICKIR